MNETTKYIPGICNINPKEVKRRRTIGIIGLIVVIAVTVILVLLNLPSLFRAIVFVPAFIMATGFIQAQSKFCVGYASAGMQHVGTNSLNIEDKEALKADKKRANKINIQALVAALVLTAITVLLPI
jgi:predicted nucleic acid-binding Zn ribbon protein